MKHSVTAHYLNRVFKRAKLDSELSNVRFDDTKNNKLLVADVHGKAVVHVGFQPLALPTTQDTPTNIEVVRIAVTAGNGVIIGNSPKVSMVLQVPTNDNAVIDICDFLSEAVYQVSMYSMDLNKEIYSFFMLPAKGRYFKTPLLCLANIFEKANMVLKNSGNLLSFHTNPMTATRHNSLEVAVLEQGELRQVIHVKQRRHAYLGSLGYEVLWDVSYSPREGEIMVVTGKSHRTHVAYDYAKVICEALHHITQSLHPSIAKALDDQLILTLGTPQ